MNKNVKIVVAMSGGVDSSVAAALLVEQGYEVIGITIKTYNYEDVGGNIGNESSCCSLDGINDARMVAAKLGFPHYVLDFSEQFKKEVIDNFVSEYLSGRTPNPCVVCNRKIKWEELIRKSVSLGAEYIATGHFAKIRYDEERNRFILSKGKDTEKDQSYALWSLTQESLRRTVFPLAEFTKPEVRELAKKFGLKTANKAESFEICFIPDDNYERFLKEQNPELEKQVGGGDMLFDGRVVAKHNGIPFYTIGQRKRLGIALGEPVYVTKIDADTNTITLGRDPELMHRELTATDVNLISVSDLKNARLNGAVGQGMHVTAKVRYKDNATGAFAKQLDSETIQVIFDDPKRAITPGQSVVMYDGDDVVGGGVIDQVIT
ncbi:MAG: tRNA 2-thiouridine(34) synthase MnmA [Bacteroidota bacterium]|nr:tRNA 2-thiouridine(34) synthase MnmA [Bacteroidota bacterium]